MNNMIDEPTFVFDAPVSVVNAIIKALNYALTHTEEFVKESGCDKSEVLSLGAFRDALEVSITIPTPKKRIIN